VQNVSTQPRNITIFNPTPPSVRNIGPLAATAVTSSLYLRETGGDPKVKVKVKVNVDLYSASS